MENAVNNLEAMKADSDINCLSQRLNNEFIQNDEVTTNPVELVQKLGDVKKEYTTIAHQVAELQEAQKEAFQVVKNELNTALQLLLKLQEAGGSEVPDKPDELEVLEQLLKTSFPWGEDSQMTESQGRQPTPSSDVSQGKQPIKSELDSTTTTTSDMSYGSEDSLVVSPSTRRQTSKEFVEVTKEEFESVSDLIRGRAKLAEVNSTYRILWEHHKTDSHKGDKLTPEDMYKLGLRVTGATGQAKLKVLRALKILKLTTKGEVTMS